MRILFCTNKFTEVSNGPAKFANLILQINQLYPQHQIRILTEDIVESTDEVYKLDLKYPNYLQLLSQFIRIFAYHRAARRLRATSFSFDVIVYNNAFIGLLSAISWPFAFGMINDDNNASRRWNQIRFNKTEIKQFLFKQLEIISVRYFRKIIVNSEYLLNYLQIEYQAAPGKLVKLYKSVETSTQMPSINRQLGRPVRILFVKSDFIRGGLWDLIDAAGILPYSVTLLIVGPSSSAFPEIQRRISKYNNIVFEVYGQLGQEEVFKLMHSVDIFCVPSHKEALGVANIEAMVRGISVVSTRVGGIPEVLDNGRAGWLVSPKDAQSLSVALCECIENENIRKQKLERALEYSQQFSVESMLNHFLSILDQNRY